MYRNLDLVQEAAKRYGRCKDGVERTYIQKSHGQAVASFESAIPNTRLNSWRGLYMENLMIIHDSLSK